MKYSVSNVRVERKGTPTRHELMLTVRNGKKEKCYVLQWSDKTRPEELTVLLTQLAADVSRGRFE